METISLNWEKTGQPDWAAWAKTFTEQAKEQARERARRVRANQKRIMATGNQDWFLFQHLAERLEIAPVKFRGEVLHAHFDDDSGPLYYMNTETEFGRQLLAGVPCSSIYDAQSSPYREEKRPWSWGVELKEPLTPDAGIEITSADEVIEAVKDHENVERMRRGVLLAEVIEFSEPQAQELLRHLRAYIERFYSSKDETILTAVGAAVRTYIAVLPVEELDRVASLLASQPSMPTPLENEIAKMVLRKLTATPPERAGMYPLLEKQLAEIAEAYLHTKWLLRDCGGPAAMNASAAIALLLAEGLKGIRELIRARCPDWFQQQLGRRTARISAELSRKHSADRIAAHKAALERLSDRTA